MRFNYLKPKAEPVELLPSCVLLASMNGTGADYDEPYELTDSEFDSIFG